MRRFAQTKPVRPFQEKGIIGQDIVRCENPFTNSGDPNKGDAIASSDSDRADGSNA